MKIPFLSFAALAAVLFVAGCETVPESAPPQKTARKAATEQGTTAAREGSSKLATDAASSSTSRAR